MKKKTKKTNLKDAVKSVIKDHFNFYFSFPLLARLEMVRYYKERMSET